MLSKHRQLCLLGAGTCLVFCLSLFIPQATSQLVTTEVPEEILRTEIIIAARSPIDGKAVSAAEYVELQAQIQTRPYPPKLSPKIRETVFLLRLRQLIRTFAPFLPI